MDKTGIKHRMEDAVERAKRQVGEWADDASGQVEGVVGQVKGKAEHALDKMKDATEDLEEKVKGLASD